MKFQIFLSILMLLNFWSNAQTTVKGIVSDQETGEGLIGVNVVAKDKTTSAEFGTSTDIDGDFSLSLDKGSYTLTFTYLGYDNNNQDVDVNGFGEIELNVSMEEASQELVITTVTSSRYEKNITKEAVSMEVIRPEFIERNANTDLAQVIERVPGVQVVDGQANIRSGSGFAYGAGSRVAVVVDEQPLLSAELSDVKWNFIPIENASQIEIIKGTASVLYGSGGLNGVINVRTAYPNSEPYTKLTTYTGLYDISNQNGRRWYGQSRDSVSRRPFFSGIYFAHRQKFKENLDVVIGSNIHYNRGFLRGDDEERYRLNANFRYRFPKNDKITVGLNTNFMRHVRGDFFLWADGRERAYEHIGVVDQFKYYTINVDPYLTAFDKQENKHSVKLRYFTVGKKTSRGNSPANVFSGEYQFQKNFEDKGLILTTGTSFQHFYAKSILFGDSLDIVGTDTIYSLNTESANVTSFYAQADKSFFNDRLNVTLGARIENFSVSSGNSSATIPVFRGGINYELSKKDFLRASFGQGYRIPSLGEKFIEDDLTDEIKVLPNPNLKLEFGSSTEIGYKRSISSKNNNWKGFFDASLYWMDYNDMTEFRFGLYPPDSLETFVDTLLAVIDGDYLGFRAVNVSRARIAGFELSAFGEGEIGRFPTRFWTGYTYSFPGDLSEDPSQKNVGKYIGNLFKGIFLKADDPLVGSILNFRALHVARADIEMDVDKFTFGVAANYNGYMYDVDDFFKAEGELESLVASQSSDVGNIVESLAEFRKDRTKGDWVFDLRISYRPSDNGKVDFIVNNLANREYALRPLKMSPPRVFNLRYSHTF